MIYILHNDVSAFHRIIIATLLKTPTDSTGIKSVLSAGVCKPLPFRLEVRDQMVYRLTCSKSLVFPSKRYVSFQEPTKLILKNKEIRLYIESSSSLDS